MLKGKSQRQTSGQENAAMILDVSRNMAELKIALEPTVKRAGVAKLEKPRAVKEHPLRLLHHCVTVSLSLQHQLCVR
jgi:hypothetical protein